jgi:hypothetical protein
MRHPVAFLCVRTGKRLKKVGRGLALGSANHLPSSGFFGAIPHDRGTLKRRNVMMDQGRKMMELSKQVLEKVSFDSRLFKKELVKARRWLGQHDQLLLKAWCLATFGHQYKDIILEVFQKSMRA